MISMEINHRIASYMKNQLNLDSDDKEIIAFSLELLFLRTINTLTIIFLSWIIGAFQESLTVLIIIAFFRSFSGGAHCSSAFRCSILSNLLIPSLGALSKFLSQYMTVQPLIFISIISILFSFIVVFKLAPVDSPAKPITSIKHRRNLRALSFLFLALIGILQFVLIAFKFESLASVTISINIGVLWQAFTLTKQGHTFTNNFDKLLIFLFKKRR